MKSSYKSPVQTEQDVYICSWSKEMSELVLTKHTVDLNWQMNNISDVTVFKGDSAFDLYSLLTGNVEIPDTDSLMLGVTNSDIIVGRKTLSNYIAPLLTCKSSDTIYQTIVKLISEGDD